MLNLLATDVGAIVDIVALVILLLFALAGFIRGFMQTMIKVFGKILSLVLAVLLCTTVANFLEGQFGLVTTLSNAMGNMFKQLLGESLANATIAEISEGSLQQVGVAGFLISIVLSFKGESGIPMDTTVGEILSPTFGYYTTMVLSILILYILFRIVFGIIGRIIGDMRAPKPLKIIDRLLGFILGAIGAVITIEILLIIISVIPISFVQEVNVYIQQSKVAKLISDTNLIGVLLNSISFNEVITYVKGLLQVA